MPLCISSSVRKKLAEKHGVSEDDILQCFANREGSFLEDTREKHKTNPATLWFIAETDFGRRLKVCFIHEDVGRVAIKTAFEPNAKEISIYEKFAK